MLAVAFSLPAMSCASAVKELGPTMKAWPIATPESQGLDSGKLAEVFAQIQQHHSPIHSLLIIRHRHLVLNAHFFPYDGNEPHDLASATKSVTATLIGIAIDHGMLAGLDTSIATTFSDRTFDGHGGKSSVTIGDLLAMRSGLACEKGHDEVALRKMRATTDWIQTMLDQPMLAPAGTAFTYCSGGMHLLSGVISQSSGRPASDFAQQTLFGPLGIIPGAWPRDPNGNNFGWGDLHLRPYDMAKIGILYLDQGRWNGQQLLSQRWVADAIRAHSHLNDNEEYGLGWWLHPKTAGGLIEASGRGGQRILIFPQHDIVMVVTGGGLDLDDFASPLIASIVSALPLPPNPSQQAHLSALVAMAAAAPEPRAAISKILPEMAHTVSEKRFRFDANPMGIETLILTFPIEAPARVKATYVDGSQTDIAIGLSGNPIVGPGGRFGLRTSAEGAWTSQHDFSLMLDEIANINAWKIQFTFDGTKVSASVRERSRGDEFSIHGSVTTLP